MPNSYNYDGNVTDFDIVIVGGGILGISLSFWLSQVTESRVCLIDENTSIASGTSGLNSGMVEGPFFYEPSSMGIFGTTVSRSRKLWRIMRERFSIPWREVGSLEVAVDEESMDIVEKHYEYSQAYDDATSIKILDKNELRGLEPGLNAVGALFSNMDAATEFRRLSEIIGDLAARRGVKFIMNTRATVFREDDDFVYVSTISNGKRGTFRAKYALNVAGPAALPLAHSMQLAKDLADFYVGSYYWELDDRSNSLFSHHIYAISKYSSKYPFLDPYLTVRANGSREMGPKPFLVGSPDYINYGGQLDSLQGLFSRPILPKLKLLTNSEFLSLLYGIKGNLFSEGAIVSKVKRFLPAIRKEALKRKYRAGKRSLIVGNGGLIHPTSIVRTPKTIHVLQYYEPGATGTPSFSALLAKYIIGQWDLGKARTTQPDKNIWNFDQATDIAMADLTGLFI